MNPPVRFRWAWLLLAYAMLGLGLLGVVLPGLPTVPFILAAAWAAMRGSPRLHAWLLAHRSFGPMIHNWQAHGAVTRRSKVLALGSMVLCAVVLFVFSPVLWAAMAGTGVMAIVAVWLWRRPEPPAPVSASGAGRK
ncbi:YbaN family protein [Luteimonas qiangzhengi]|uniref:YbaN family protein n=1 Tax=Luteimonas sp. MJ146 TaxID=3129240 RepID=UPI0031BB37D6